MPRYLFHIVGGSRRFIDDEGADLPDLAIAQEEARKDAEDLTRARFETLRAGWADWSIEICDVEGNVLATVPFDIDPN